MSGPCGPRAWILWLLLALHGPAWAADPDLARGRELLDAGQAQESLDYFRRSLEANPDSVDAHLGLGRAYRALGDLAAAKLAFETVLRFDDLPPDLRQQVEIYDQAARAYAEGRRLLAFGYAMAGYGNYRVNGTAGSVSGEADDNFYSLRAGGSLNYELADNWSLDGSLDYRFRDYYDEPDRRNDSDLRWNGAVDRADGEANWLLGARGRVSYRGNSDYRNDFGAYGEYRLRLDADNQVAGGMEIRQRRYPTGPLRDRTRNIMEFTASWTRALWDGKASFTLAGQAGHEYNTQREDGDANFFGLSPSLSFTLTNTLGGFIFAWWQNDRYNIERIERGGSADDVVGIGTRNDNLYEVGGVLSWEFTPGWSVNPEVLYLRDDSNIAAANYSSTEVWVTLRADF